jgi:predicted permease
VHFESLLKSLIILVVLAGCAIWLRRRSSILQSEEGVFPRLITDFTLPALIFANLSREPVKLQDLSLALVMFCAIASVMLVAWFIGRRMRLERPVLGSVILVSGAGASSTLGYCLIQQMFANNAAVMSEVIVMGEVGVILPLFIFGVAIAVHFGETTGDAPNWGATTKAFFCSPIFVALVLGLAASFIGLPEENAAVRLLDKILHIASASLPLLVAFTIGLMLRPIAYKKMIRLVLLVGVLKLVLEPLIAAGMALALTMPALGRDILVVEAAMPSGALAAVLAARYGCDGAVASALLIVTLCLSLLVIPAMGYLAF